MRISFLPNLPLGVMLSWEGPLYSGDGLVLNGSSATVNKVVHLYTIDV